ncbi:MAG: protein kinase [Pirellulales bacterium]
MNKPAHPEPRQLADYVSGALPEADASAVAQHLAECSACENTVEQIEAKSDTMLSGLRGKAPAEPYVNETEFRRAAQNAAGIAERSGAEPAAAAKDPQPSTKAPSPQLGPYKLLAKLGEGGMGAVFKAQHEHLEKLVAIKVLPKAAMNDKAAVDRFRREMKAVGRLHHPNIVTAHDAGEARGVHFLVMEYVEGSDLSSLLKKKGPLVVEQAAAYVLQAARGLAFAHAKGIIHRDIKPANLLVDGEGTVKILDMGLARLEGDAASKDAKDGLTQTGQVMGTVDYMAPEQAFDTHRADGKADVYSLGCTLYRLITGKNAFDGETLVQKILSHRESPIPSLAAARPEAPAALDALYQRMMAKHPKIDRRWPTSCANWKRCKAAARRPWPRIRSAADRRRPTTGSRGPSCWTWAPARCRRGLRFRRRRNLRRLPKEAAVGNRR